MTMTPEDFADEMQWITDTYGHDKESAHSYMDDLMVKVLVELGYQGGVDVFDRQGKWYA